MDNGGNKTRSVAAPIRRSLDRLTPTERRPALTLLASYPVAGLETVAQFAARAHASGPTILRLVAKLGFVSYLDFQQALRDELELRLQTPLAKAPPGSSGLPQRDFLSTYTRAIIDIIETSIADVPREDFEAAVALLADARWRVLLIGGRFTSSLAAHLYLRLRELRLRVQLVAGQTATWAEHLLDLGRHDVLIVFDIRRFQEDIVRFAREAAAGGTHVLLFTDIWVSPAAAVADHVFSVRTTMPSSWESFAALSALSEALIERLHAERWNDSSRRMEKLESLRAHLSAEEPPQ